MRRFRYELLNERTPGGGYRAIPEEPIDLDGILRDVLCCQLDSAADIFAKFAPVFFCFRNPSSIDLACMQIMLKALKTGALKYRLEFLSVPPDLNDIQEGDHPVHTRTRESAEHKGMKQWVRQHLQQTGISPADGEISFLGYRVDAGCIPAKVFVECGDTEPKKIWDFLVQGENIGVLQYNAEEIIWFLSSSAFKQVAHEESQKLF